jgi:hypothetical protein
MLAKCPDDRMSVAQVLAHSWTLKHYPGPKNTLEVYNESAKSVLRTIKESTLIPYLAQVFNAEIESDLESRGTYNDAHPKVRKSDLTLDSEC